MFTGFAKLRQTLTLLVFLRRIARALQQSNVIAARANELAELRLRMEHPAAYKSGTFSPGGNGRSQPKLAEMGVADVEGLNKSWAEKHPALTQSSDDEDEYNIT